ncbi:MAG: hypothetical protein CVV32_04670 [Methanomicrobiales archaeon HGW-Methanomicrobiales-3]|jgi:DNA-binding response OmpR family regulator|nr:MAG: hypothetical protein CVV32_04670 [Methanomicrobiales archaeon HGW-Methanomicrobiales-3]
MTDSILIVDDSTFIVEGLVALLKKSYNPIPSYGGEECLEILRTVMPSLIILDIMMEPMDGWETLARIKNNTKTRHIPVLMFSAKKISFEEAEAHRIIIDDFLTKPVNPKKLIEAIEKVLSRQAANKQITGSWEAAGVSREIIDEFLAIKTNLDVDVSLLAVMKKQLDMAYPDAENRSELARSIATLEARIAGSRKNLESFCEKQGDVLPHENRPPATMPEIPPAQPGPAEPSPAVPQAELRSPVADTSDPPARTSPPVPVVPSPEREHPEPAAEPAPPAPRADPLPPVPAAETLPANEIATTPVSGSIVQEPALQPVPVPPATVVKDGGASTAAKPDGSSSFPPASAPGKTMAVSDSLFEDYGEPSATVPEKPQETAFPEAASMAPSVVRTFPPVPAIPPGGGTRTPSMKSPETTRREPGMQPAPATERPSPGQPPTPAGSLFSRIIAAITGLFSKKRS